MENNIECFCELYATSTNLPLSYYSCSGRFIRAFFNIDSNIELIIFNQLIDSYKNFKKNPSVLIPDSEGFYGMVNIEATDEYLLVGPVFSIPVSDAKLQVFMKENAVPNQYKYKLQQYLHFIPNLSYHQFLANLQLLHYYFNGKKIDIFEHFYSTSSSNETNVDKKFVLQSYDKKEHLSFHNTYIFEQQLLNYVKNGDTAKIKEMLILNTTTAQLKEGIVADSPLRQSKNIFIGLVTTIGKQAAIAGGLDIEEAYQLIDIYSQDCERLRLIDDVMNLYYVMIIDFCERVRRKRIPEGSSKEINECINYINNHTNEKLSISDIAKYIGKSTSCISHKFKEELGFSIGSFINQCKLEEARSLLKYSDKSIAEIGNYLCFSSQSYFQNVFKNKYGITPNQYRSKSK